MKKQLIEKSLSPAARASINEIQLFDDIDSSNAESLRQIQAGKRGVWIVLAETQSAGRGRRGRSWYSRRGAGIYLSLVRQFTLDSGDLQSLSLVAAISLQSALSGLGVENLQLKWPNDVLHRKRKLAGILLELQATQSCIHLVFGIGINLKLPASALVEIGRPVTDLNSLTENSLVAEEVVAAVVSELLCNIERFEADGFSVFQQVWNRQDCYLGSDIVIENGPNRTIGTSLGVDASGALVLQCANGRQLISGGEIFPSLREVPSE